MNWNINWKFCFFCQSIFSLGWYFFTKNIEIQIFNYTLTIVYLILWRTGDKNV